jgi:hypothetical protein
MIVMRKRMIIGIQFNKHKRNFFNVKAQVPPIIIMCRVASSILLLSLASKKMKTIFLKIYYQLCLSLLRMIIISLSFIRERMKSNNNHRQTLRWVISNQKWNFSAFWAPRIASDKKIIILSISILISHLDNFFFH